MAFDNSANFEEKNLFQWFIMILKKPPTFMIIKRNAYRYVVNYEYKLYAYYCTQEFRFCNLQVAIFFK